MALIYKIYNNINGKVYIGKTDYSINKRFAEHLRDSRKADHQHRPLYRAINKYGADQFLISVIEDDLTSEDACTQEQKWIEYYRSYVGFDNCNGYNATLGGDSRTYYDYSEMANKYVELGTVRSAAKFFDCDVATVRKACAQNGVSILSAKELSGKQIYQIKDGEIVNTYASSGEVNIALGKKRTNGAIRDALNARRGHHRVYGFEWYYVEEYNKGS